MPTSSADPQPPLLAISSFARLVGLSPSALRFYDDCGLLRPARVDEHTGYRYYSADQERRGVLIRRLREIDLPLAQIREVVDGSPHRAAETLRTHVASQAGLAARAHEVAEDVLSAVTQQVRSQDAQCVVGGPELASAVRQVSPAAASRAGVPPLEGVLLEIGDDELTLVATNRYWLAMRTVPVTEAEPGQRVVVPAEDLVDVAGWARRHDRVRIQCHGTRVDLQAGDQHRDLSRLEGEFPQYGAIFDGLEDPVVRVIVDRHRLIELLEQQDGDEAVVLTSGSDHLDVRLDGERHGIRLDAVCSGEPRSVAFSPALIGSAVRAGVGPDAVLEWRASDRPVVVRSADQGTFTTLVMPVRRESPSGS